MDRSLPLLLMLSLACASAQTPQTRAEAIQQERKAKAGHLTPDEVSKPELVLRTFKEQKYLERIAAGYNGLRVKIGNMVTGGGFALGPEYFREDLLRGQLTARASAQVSTRGYTKFEAQALAPRLADGKLALEVLASRRDYSGLQYYGNGPDTRREFRANYRLEDTSIDGIAAVQPVKGLKLGASTGFLATNVGPGRDKRFASAETVFTPADAPGIDQQTNFFRNGVFAQWDYRDDPLGMAKSGGNYVLQYSWFRDQQFDRYSFRRMDIELQQFLPILNKTRVFALRAKTTLTDADGANQVPFYLRPIVGGSDDLRGYRFFRFSDANMMVLNGEYRWEIFSGLDGAVFVDAGKVFPRRGMLNFSNLESSVGFGLRFNARNAAFLRVDVGFSHEGYQVWIKFNDVFNQRRFGTTTGQPVY